MKEIKSVKTFLLFWFSNASNPSKTGKLTLDLNLAT